MATIKDVIDATSPLLFLTDEADFPYAYGGSCYPVKWKDQLYIVSAFHCYDNLSIKPENTLYPIPQTNVNFFGFTNIFRAVCNNANDPKHSDQILLQVCKNNVSETQFNAVAALDLSNENYACSLTDPSVTQVLLRGYLNQNDVHAIDYESCVIRSQAYFTYGLISAKKSISDYCTNIKIQSPTPSGLPPTGMSGSAVYVTRNNNQFSLAGTVIEYNTFTNEFLVIDSSVIVNFLRQINIT